MLIRDGAPLVSGPCAEVIGQDNLRALYGAQIVKVGRGAGAAFLPG